MKVFGKLFGTHMAMHGGLGPRNFARAEVIMLLNSKVHLGEREPKLASTLAWTTFTFAQCTSDKICEQVSDYALPFFGQLLALLPLLLLQDADQKHMLHWRWLRWRSNNGYDCL